MLLLWIVVGWMSLCSGNKILGNVGETILLTCFYEGNEKPPLENVHIAWYDSSDNLVREFKSGEDEVKERTRIFKDEVKKGNFSLELNNIKQSDAGTYDCKAAVNNPMLNHITEVHLTVSEEKGKKFDDRTETNKTGNGSITNKPEILHLGIYLLGSMIHNYI